MRSHPIRVGSPAMAPTPLPSLRIADWAPVPVGPTWYFDTVLPDYEWTYTSKVIGHTLAGVALHSPRDPEHYAYVAQYIYEIQHGLLHLLNVTQLPINMVGDIPTLRWFLHRLHELQPQRFRVYRSYAMIWAQNLCARHADQLLLLRIADGTIPPTPLEGSVLSL